MEEKKRRPTADIIKLRNVCQASYRAVVRSQKYAEISAGRNRDRWVSDAREIEILWWGVMVTLNWVLGEDLTAEERQRVIVELEDALDGE